MVILGISGKRGSGKSLLATELEEYGFKRMSLAADLKQRVRKDFGLDKEQTDGIFKESPTQYKRTDGNPLSARDIMIRCGVYYRSIDPLFFCRILDKEMEIKAHSFYNQKQDKFVIDDIRFLNELDFFGKLGAKFIRIERLQKLNTFKAALDDLSETELDKNKKWDYFLPAKQNKVREDMRNFAKEIAHGLGLVSYK